MKNLFVSILFSMVCLQLSAQNISNPYASIGKKAPKVSTVTSGEYEEFFTKDSLVQIGTTVLNRYTGEVTFFEEDNLEKFKQFTEHSEKNFRFLSVDPLARDYSELTPYQYSSNRPIDGIDIDGLEYYSVHYKIYVDQGGNVHRSYLRTVDHTDNAKGYGNRGPGVEYVITHERHTTTGEKYSFTVKDLKKNFYGVYVGPTNPLKYYENPDSKNNYSPDYILPPIDELDAAAKQHDKDYDVVGAKGPTSAFFDNKTLQADVDLVTKANKVIDKYNKGEMDAINGGKVSNEEYKAAQNVGTLFKGIAISKYTNLLVKNPDAVTEKELKAIEAFSKKLESTTNVNLTETKDK